MKVAVLGANGYIGNYLQHNLQGDVYPVTRADVDLLDYAAVMRFFEQHQFDVVINAAKHPEYELAERPDIFDANIKMFMNVVAAQDNYARLINLGSGAEFDRQQYITTMDHRDLYARLPADGYGKSRNLISRFCEFHDNFYTVRLFGVLHHSEPDFKLFRKIADGKPVTVRDCCFDYMSLTDVNTVIQHYVDTAIPKYKDINAVYLHKHLLSDLIDTFCAVQGIENTTVIDSVAGFNYTGCGEQLQDLNIPLIGLRKCFEEYK